MSVEIFTLKYLEFILSSFFTFVGFVIMLLIITRGTSKITMAIKDFFSDVKSRYRRFKVYDDISDKAKEKMPKL